MKERVLPSAMMEFDRKPAKNIARLALKLKTQLHSLFLNMFIFFFFYKVRVPITLVKQVYSIYIFIPLPTEFLKFQAILGG